MTNEQRAERFFRAMLTIQRWYDEDEKAVETNLIDLLTDARHEARLYNSDLDIDAIVRMSEIHFNAECEEEAGG